MTVFITRSKAIKIPDKYVAVQEIQAAWWIERSYSKQQQFYGRAFVSVYYWFLEGVGFFVLKGASLKRTFKISHANDLTWLFWSCCPWGLTIHPSVRGCVLLVVKERMLRSSSRAVHEHMCFPYIHKGLESVKAHIHSAFIWAKSFPKSVRSLWSLLLVSIRMDPPVWNGGMSRHKQEKNS